MNNTKILIRRDPRSSAAAQVVKNGTNLSLPDDLDAVLSAEPAKDKSLRRRGFLRDAVAFLCSELSRELIF